MEYKHFSHEHNLSIYQVQLGQQFRCSGCDKFCDRTIYACWQCKFFLHEHCGNATRYIRHPFHAAHHLILSPYPTYPSNCFLCNACGTTGTRFSYCCALCEVDLHVNCAFLPPKSMDSKHWSYECLICANYKVHTLCATTEMKMGLYQMDDGSDGSDQGAPMVQQGAPMAQQAPSDGQVQVELTPEEALALLHIMGLSNANAASY
ncbi:C1-like protein, partial [Cynara cardunculus var. scolymus]